MCIYSYAAKVLYKRLCVCVSLRTTLMCTCAVSLCVRKQSRELFFIVYLGIENSYFLRNRIGQWAKFSSRYSYRSLVPKYTARNVLLFLLFLIYFSYISICYFFTYSVVSSFKDRASISDNPRLLSNHELLIILKNKNFTKYCFLFFTIFTRAAVRFIN